MAGESGPRRTRQGWPWLVAALLLLGCWQLLQREAGPGMPEVADSRPVPTVAAPPPAVDGGLPPEARATLALIDRGGPFPHRQDGGVFHNREQLLPGRPRGHYREYTVETPGLDHRGPRRIVTGGDPPVEWYYTADHYRSFRAFEREPRP